MYDQIALHLYILQYSPKKFQHFQEEEKKCHKYYIMIALHDILLSKLVDEVR